MWVFVLEELGKLGYFFYQEDRWSRETKNAELKTHILCFLFSWAWNLKKKISVSITIYIFPVTKRLILYFYRFLDLFHKD